MNDLIERSKAVDAIYWNVMEVNSKEMAESILSDVPTVDPVKHGHWIEAKYPLSTCSECGATYQDTGYGYNYCPNCGAKMDEEVNENGTLY